MTTIVTRAGKGSPLTWNEVDNNFTNLNSAKYESGDSPSFAGLTISTFTSGSVLFAGASGLVSQDNANFFWDDTNNRLGLGTSSPNQRLTVSSTGTYAAAMWNETAVAAGVGSSILIAGGTAGNGLAAIGGYFSGAATTDGGYLTLSTRAVTSGTITERMRIDSSGNVGIGTASPQDTLEISKSGGAYLRLSNSNTASVSEAIGGIKFYSADASGSQNIVRTLIESYTNSIGATSDLRFSTTPDGTGATPIERMRITTGGNVGIATTDPTGGFTFDSAYRMLGIAGSGSASTASTGALNLINNRATPASGDYFGLINFFSSNSVSGNILKAQILSSSDGSGGVTGGFGGNLRFYTKPDNSATAATERMRITSGGNALIGVTSANANGGILQLSGGITFPATQVAATDANTLDDYEEGTFTPTISGSTTAGTGTYTTQVGRYTKVGNRVFFTAYAVWTAHTGTGNLRVAGLPFTSNSTASNYNAPSVWNQNITLTASNLMQAYVEVNATVVIITQYPVGGGASSNVAMDAAGSIMVTGQYEV